MFDRKYIKLLVEDFESLKTKAKATEAIERIIKDHEQKFDSMVDEVISVEKKLTQEKAKMQQLQKEKADLQKDNKILKSQLNQLMDFAKSQLEKFYEWQKERQ